MPVLLTSVLGQRSGDHPRRLNTPAAHGSDVPAGEAFIKTRRGDLPAALRAARCQLAGAAGRAMRGVLGDVLRDPARAVQLDGSASLASFRRPPMSTVRPVRAARAAAAVQAIAVPRGG